MLQCGEQSVGWVPSKEVLRAIQDDRSTAMRNVRWGALGVAVFAAGGGFAQQAGAPAGASGTSLTIYNQDFAVVRAPVELDLKAGTTDVKETNVTSQLEPDSVVLRDPAGKREIQL